MLLSELSVVTPYDSNISSCGYCKSSNGSRTYGMSAHFLTPLDYQELVNRGWRRSGKYLYKPNLRDSCCPQYTIRLKTSEFQASKHQRQIVNRFNTFIQEGDDNFEKDIQERQNARKEVSETVTELAIEGTEEQLTKDTSETDSDLKQSSESSILPSPPKDSPTSGKKQKPKKPPKHANTDLKSRIRASEYLLSPEITSWKYRLKIKLEPSSYTDEKYQLYVKYQTEVHHEPLSKCTSKGFTGFLVDSPINASKQLNWTEDDPGFGSFHQCYYLDEKLIAVSVIDILPECVSAVYFYYDTDYSCLSLGKYSAQREIALAEVLRANPGYENLNYYYMGFYIFSCPKMSYKGQFHPSFLLDPETYNWIDFKKCQDILKDQRYSAFENPVPMDPLFEEKIKSIVERKKKPFGSGTDEDDDDEYEDIDDDDGYEDIDDDEDGDDDNGEIISEADFDGSDSGGNEKEQSKRKKKRLEDNNSNDAESKRKLAEEKAEQEKKRERNREIERVFSDITSLPPPGTLKPENITELDLSEIICLTSTHSLKSVVLVSSYKSSSKTRERIKKYYSNVGSDLATKLIVYI